MTGTSGLGTRDLNDRGYPYAMEMLENFLVGFVASAVVGWLLWIVLPRGIVLSRKFPAHNFAGSPIPDTWILRNESSLPVRIAKVEAIGAAFDGSDWNDLSPLEAMKLGFFPTLDSDISGGEALAGIERWKEVRVMPGDGLQVKMPGNTVFRITYRRDSIVSFVETRQVTVFGMP